MSARTGAILGLVVLLTLAACGRRLPSPAPETQAAASGTGAGEPQVELAGGPPAEAAPGDVAPAGQPAEADPTTTTAQAAPDSPPAGVSGGEPAAGTDDPLEPVNRRLYVVDRAVGRAIVQRAQGLAGDRAPAHAAVSAVRNVLNNLDEPSVAANDLLQRKVGRALKSAARFLINSTIGIAGVRDVAAKMGIRRRDNSLDRTLASYGAPAGPYLYLPIAGPTTLRAAVGAAVEGYLYPPHWLHVAEGVGVALRGASYAKLARTALVRAAKAPPAEAGRDGYERTRSAYLEAEAGRPRPDEPSKTALASR